MNSQGVNVCSHHIAQGSKYHTVLIQGTRIAKSRRYDGYRVVPLAISCARMTFMEMALVHYLELRRREGFLEQCSNTGQSVWHDFRLRHLRRRPFARCSVAPSMPRAPS